ncbi:PTS fructose transporter subunit IIB [Streptococcus cuniculi]|uniref:PTS fructose transporter subunit IIB n=1 Tax=Streptococcus cuniculi TaxID=1432788 RepID=A0A4Y9JA34_9STRE|nr:PTS fructose transporter subunit IIB [Streptococcus cuniculi]MBF0779058.1 PTS fructose transporter subunit IIB [Streptococcus cuniculi]TFU96956.1 PTS fructose transporter subunit IIB [Streptococcus cuniculi]
MKIVGITSCPAGLAHTPMAAKALEKAGSKLGHQVRIEQQGSMGQVNQLTEQEIASADFVLLATDQKITGQERFEGKKQIRINIVTCIKAPEAVLKKCVEAVSNKS